MFQEGLSPRWPNAGDHIQLGGQAQLGALFAMGCDSEAVSLVSNALHKVQTL